MASIEELLLAQAADDYQTQQTISSVATALGALGAGAVGYDLGTPELMARDANRRLQHMVDPKLAATENKLIRRLTPGPRMAGGLIGAVLGGALAPAAVKEILGPSEAVEILAKAKTGGLDDNDKMRLRQMIIDNQQATGVI